MSGCPPPSRPPNTGPVGCREPQLAMHPVLPQQGNNSLELSGALARDACVSVTDSSSSLVVSQNEANENKPRRAGPSETSRVDGGAFGILIARVVVRGKVTDADRPRWWMKPGPALPAPPKPTPPWPGGVLLQVGTKPQGS